jgi:hypothetical protein
MNFLSLFIYSWLLIMALWCGKGAVKSVGIYRYSRGMVAARLRHDPAMQACDDPKCPAVTLISGIEDTHRKVRTEAVFAVVSALATLVAAAVAFVVLMGRLA